MAEKKKATGARGSDRCVLLRKSSDELAVRWQFHRDHDGRWRWEKHSDQRVSRCTAGFSRYAECVSDAKAHGYREWIAPDRKRLTPLSFDHAFERDAARSEHPPNRSRVVGSSPAGHGPARSRNVLFFRTRSEN